MSSSNGLYACSFPLVERGSYSVQLMFDQVPLVGSPFAVVVVDGSDSSKVKVSSPPVGVVGSQVSVHINTKRAGQGAIGLLMEGPSEAAMTCTDQGDGTCVALFTPTVPGLFELGVKFADKPVPGSPFKYWLFATLIL